MRSSSFIFALLVALPAHADGFLVERLQLAPAGAGWLVNDALDMHGSFGGAASLSFGYSFDSFVVGPLPVVVDQATAVVGLAATYDRYRLSLNIENPFVASGTNGDVSGLHFTAPAYGPSKIPDLVSDVRVGLDARIAGDSHGLFRFGASAQLFIPSGSRADYDSDETFRAMLRLLFAGDIERFTYAASIGVHIRPLDERKIPGGPRGSELIFSAAGGERFWLHHVVIVFGPEIFGETAFEDFFGATHTGLEVLASGRIESEGDDRLNWRVKAGFGGGIVPSFGAPECRIVVSVELFGQRSR